MGVGSNIPMATSKDELAVPEDKIVCPIALPYT